MIETSSTTNTIPEPNAVEAAIAKTINDIEKVGMFCDSVGKLAAILPLQRHLSDLLSVRAELLRHLPAVDEAMRKVAAIAHSGGLIDMSPHDALTAIRRLSLPYWGKEEKPEQVHATLATRHQEPKS